MVVCDEWLQYLFGKKVVAKNKIYDLLETHFAENHDDSEDELLYSSEENDENFKTSYKKQKVSGLDKQAPVKKKEPETPKSCFAAITSDNLKLVYLRRCLVQDFLKDPESFDGKVVGSYVRVKSDPNDYTQKNSHQLLPVTGVRRASGRDGVAIEILLQLPTLIKDTPLSKLSDDNFSEEECEELGQRVKAGSVKRPTVVELEQRAGILHEAITKHWLAKELVKLQNLIDRANEKGWRKELYDHMEQKKLLQTPSEQSRLLSEVPKVIAEELEVEAKPQDQTEDTKQEDNKEEDSCPPKSVIWEASDISIDFTKKAPPNQNSASTDAAAPMLLRSPIPAASSPPPTPVVPSPIGSKDVVFQSQITSSSSVIRDGQQDLITKITSDTRRGIEDALGTYKQGNKTAPLLFRSPVPAASSPPPTLVVPSPIGSEDVVMDFESTFWSHVIRGDHQDFFNKLKSDTRPGIRDALGTSKQDNKTEAHPARHIEQPKQQALVVTSSETEIVNVEEVTEGPKVVEAQVIELSDDDNDAVVNIEVETIGQGSCVQQVDDPASSIWYYLDPQRNIQGPFSMNALKRWKDANFFATDFTVWKTGQIQGQAVLLADLLRVMFP